MSDRAISIHGIVEGPSDGYVLQAFAAAILGTDRIVWTTLQPEASVAFGQVSYGPHGGGWKGVRSKCMEIAKMGGVVAAGVLANAHALVVHVDGEVAAEDELQLALPCPPPEPTAEALRAEVRGWLGAGAVHRKVVVAVPCMETEAWLIPGMRPHADPAPCVECVPKPSMFFQGGRPRLVEQSGKKRLAEYKKNMDALREAWAASAGLSIAQSFAADLRAAVAEP